MITKICALNQVYSAVITASSEDYQFPLSNLKDDRRSKVFRTTSNSGYIVLDFGEEVAIDNFAIVGDNDLGVNLSSLTVSFNNVNSWGSPIFSSVVSIDYDYEIGRIEFTEINARYARLDFTSIDLFCEISKIFIGKKVNINMDIIYPINFGYKTLSNISENRMGQKFIDEIGTKKQLGISYAYLNKNEAEALFELIEYCGITRPLWVFFDTANITLNNNRMNGYYYMTEDSFNDYIAGNFWSFPFKLEEGM